MFEKTTIYIYDNIKQDDGNCCACVCVCVCVTRPTRTWTRRKNKRTE